MNNVFKLVVASIAGLVSTQASAAQSFEEELYEKTLEQGTIEAAEVFLQSFPESAYADEISAMLSTGIRAELRSGKFAPVISSVDVAYDATGYAGAAEEATPGKKAKRTNRKAKRKARRAERRAYIREARKKFRESVKDYRDRKHKKRRGNKHNGGDY